MALIDSISDQIQGKHMAKECLGIITWDRLMISGGGDRTPRFTENLKGEVASRFGQNPNGRGLPEFGQNRTEASIFIQIKKKKFIFHILKCTTGGDGNHDWPMSEGAPRCGHPCNHF